MDSTDFVVMWRCTTCRKWSHAVRRPSSHRRWVQPGDPKFVADKDETRGWGHEPGGHLVDCGPFEQWEARRCTPAGDVGGSSPAVPSREAEIAAQAPEGVAS